jgi:hypothetical protein
MERHHGHGHLRRLSDVGHVDILGATTSREEFASLLDHLAVIAAPGDGAAVLVALFDQLAIAGGSGWLEGDLAVELFEEEGATTPTTRVRVMSELGGGLREQVLPTLSVRVPIAELTAYEPIALRREAVSSRCAMLFAVEPVPTSTDFEISQTCLAAFASPHEDVDAGWDA